MTPTPETTPSAPVDTRSTSAPPTRRQRGASLVEYGLLAGLISVASIGAVMATGVKVEETFCRATSSIAYVLGHDYDVDCLPSEIAALREDGDGSAGGTDSGAGNTYTRPDPAPAPDGYDADGFEHEYEFPMYTVGRQNVMLPISAYAFPAGSSYVVARSGGSNLQTCIERADSSLECAPGRLEIAPGDRGIGWSVLLPDDPRPDWSSAFAFDIEDAGMADIQVWSIDATRVPEPYIFEPDIDFRDKFYVAGTGGWQQVMVPLKGRFNGDLRWQAQTDGSSTNRTCFQIEAGGEITCDDQGSDYNWAEIPMEAHAIGYEFDLGDGDSTKSLAWDFTGRLTLKGKSQVTLEDGTTQSLIESYPWTVTRDPQPAIVDPDFTFADVLIPARTAGEWFAAEIPFTGTFNSAMRFRTSNNAPSIYGDRDVQVCVLAQEGDTTPDCEDFSVEVPQDAHALVLSISPLANVAAEYIRDIELELYSLDQPESNSTWSITATRPQDPYSISPDFDIETFAFPAGSYGYQYKWSALTGEYDIGDKDMEFYSDAASVAPCVRYADGSEKCFSSKTRVPNDAQAIGYRINFGSSDNTYLNRSYTVDFRLELYGRGLPREPRLLERRRHRAPRRRKQVDYRQSPQRDLGAALRGSFRLGNRRHERNPLAPALAERAEVSPQFFNMQE